MEIDLFLVGIDEDDAMATMPFECEDSAFSYMKDQGDDARMWQVTATIDFSTMKPVDTTWGDQALQDANAYMQIMQAIKEREAEDL